MRYFQICISQIQIFLFWVLKKNKQFLVERMLSSLTQAYTSNL